MAKKNQEELATRGVKYGKTEATIKEPNIILWDIETTHNIVAAFGLYDQNIPIDAIIRERCIICVCWKRLGEKRVHSVSLIDDMKRFKRNPGDDSFVVKKVHEVLSEADVVVAHNGDRFDMKWFNTRALINGLPPLPKIPSVDTYKVARNKLYLNSNKLDYLGKILKCGAKIKTNLGMWIGVLEGKAKSVREMVKYNKQDVLLLEKVYLKLRGMMPGHPSFGVITRDDGIRCRVCGGTDMIRKGYTYTGTAMHQKYRCKDETCGAWSSSRVNLLKGKKFLKGV